MPNTFLSIFYSISTTKFSFSFLFFSFFLFSLSYAWQWLIYFGRSYRRMQCLLYLFFLLCFCFHSIQYITFSLRQLAFPFFYSLTFLYFLLLWCCFQIIFPLPLSKHPVTLPAEFSIHNPSIFSDTNHVPSHPFLVLSDCRNQHIFPSTAIYHSFVLSGSWITIHAGDPFPTQHLCVMTFSHQTKFSSMSVIHTFHHFIVVIFTNICFASTCTNIQKDII